MKALRVFVEVARGVTTSAWLVSLALGVASAQPAQFANPVPVGAREFGLDASTHLVEERGTLSEKIEELKALVFRKQTNGYVAPTALALTNFRELARSIENGQLVQATTQAQALGYLLVFFEDIRDGRVFYLLREQLDALGEQSLGWGSYIYDPSGRNVLIEVPHPLSDRNTPELAVDVFYGAGTKGYLMAGAHRLANGGDPGVPTSQPANVAGEPNSVFQAVHEEWSDQDTIPIQIHGFNVDNHAYPFGTDAVLSNGCRRTACTAPDDGSVPWPHQILDQEFDDATRSPRLLSFVWNMGDPNNGLVNRDWRTGRVVDGRTFYDLSANYNVQGHHTRDARGQPFLHVELEQSIRIDDPDRWARAVDALIEGAILVPEPSAGLLGITALLVLSAFARRRPRP
jgi:hypothetical protein